MKKLKEKLNEKLSKNGGFTLVEMLIVVAIIAILIAVSIPLVTSSLDKAKEATDKANLRAAKAEAIIMYMNDQTLKAGETASIKTGDIYDIDSGTFDYTGTTGYNKYKSTGGATAENTKVIKVTIGTGDDPVTVSWEDA